MNAPSNVGLDQVFPHLGKAPIVEAVISIATTPTVDFSESTHKEIFKSRLPDYPNQESAKEFELGFNIDFSQPAQFVKNSGWLGFRFRNAEQTQIAQFNRTNFSFSRLKPYEDWQRFMSEAMRLWNIYKEILDPKNVNRIGLRFINQIPVPIKDLDLDHYLEAGPKHGGKLNFPLSGFTHIDQLSVPGSPFEIRVIQTIISPAPDADAKCNLVLDIDVITMQPIVVKSDVVEETLRKMRYLKNYVFFNSLTPLAIKQLT